MPFHVKARDAAGYIAQAEGGKKRPKPKRDRSLYRSDLQRAIELASGDFRRHLERALDRMDAEAVTVSGKFT